MIKGIHQFAGQGSRKEIKIVLISVANIPQWKNFKVEDFRRPDDKRFIRWKEYFTSLLNCIASDEVCSNRGFVTGAGFSNFSGLI